jgi:Amt family ammonium transporter
MTLMKYLFAAVAAIVVLCLAHFDPALAQEAAAGTPATPPPSPINTGDTAWMLTSTALVLMMTIPGLALFYGGMVRKKNVLATIGQAFGATCIITVLWMVIGYSIGFTTNDSESLN